MSINKSGVKTVAKAKSFALTAKEYFGLKVNPNTGEQQTTAQFSAELKELSETDRADLVEYFTEAGITLDPKSARTELEKAGRPIPAQYAAE